MRSGIRASGQREQLVQRPKGGKACGVFEEQREGLHGCVPVEKGSMVTAEKPVSPNGPSDPHVSQSLCSGQGTGLALASEL